MSDRTDASGTSSWLIPGCLGLITLGGLGLRLWNLEAGLPHFPGADEPTLIGLAVRFGTEDLNPHFFIYPTLWPYTLFVAFGGFFVIGKMIGVFASLQDFKAHYFLDPSSFFLIGRLLSAFLGTATIPIVHYLGTRLASSRIGLLAATALAVAPLHVQYSHYLLTDAPLTFAVASSFLLLLGLSASQSGVRLWQVGLVAGLATSVKYPAGLLALPVLVAVVNHLPRPLTAGDIFASGIRTGVWMVAGFLVGTPYALLDAPAFFAGVREDFVQAWTGHLGVDPNVNGFVHYLTKVLPEGAGTLLGVLGVAGFLWMTVIGITRRQLPPLLAACFVIPYFLMVGSTKIPFARYMLPLFPFAMIYAGFVVERLAQSIPVGGRWRAVACLCLLVVTISAPLGFSLNWVSSLSLPDTRWIAKEWLEQHVPPGSTVVTEWYGPPLSKSSEQLHSQIVELRGLSGRDPEVDRQLERWVEKYEILSRLPAVGPSFVLYVLDLGRPPATAVDRVPYDVAALKAKGVKNVVLTSYMYERFRRFPSLYPDQARFYDELGRTGRLLFDISPLEVPCTASPDVLMDMTTLDRRCIRHNGPALKIFDLGSGARVRAGFLRGEAKPGYAGVVDKVGPRKFLVFLSGEIFEILSTPRPVDSPRGRL